MEEVNIEIEEDEEEEIIKLITEAAQNFKLENKGMPDYKFFNRRRLPQQFHVIRVYNEFSEWERRSLYFNTIKLYLKEEAKDYKWEVRFSRKIDDTQREHYFKRRDDVDHLYRIGLILEEDRTAFDNEFISNHAQAILEMMYQFEEDKDLGFTEKPYLLDTKKRELCFIQ